MSEENFMGLAFRTERTQHPERFTIDEKELDKKLKVEAKERAERDANNTKLREQREAARKGTTPAQILKAETKKKHWALKEDVKNASVREHSYGHPDVAHWQAEVDKAEASLVKPLSPGDEGRINLALVTAKQELVEAQARLKRYQAEHTRATGLLKSFEAENKIA
jgi:hypothetical protein